MQITASTGTKRNQTRNRMCKLWNIQIRPPRSCSTLACVEYSCRNIVTSRKLKKQDGLQDLEDIRQYPTSTGKIGYMGLKPLKGDLEHHYYVQIFTFDIMFWQVLIAINYCRQCKAMSLQKLSWLVDLSTQRCLQSSR